MQKLICEEILKATGGKLEAGYGNTAFTGISTDSRKIKTGDLFIPLAGQNFDGHDFIQKAIDSGAAGVVTQKHFTVPEGKAVILVKDTSAALRDIAAYYRNKFPVPFVGITGSVGKTSTKDMVACAVGTRYRVLKTEGNFNNEIGVPLTVLNLNSTHEAAVVEMGMSSIGEISRLTAIVKPHIAIITNIGISHIEKLGSRQNILKAKMEILEGLDRDGLVILNGDDTLLRGARSFVSFRTKLYGLEEECDYQAYNIKALGEDGSDFDILVGGSEYRVHVPLPGIHNVYNALAAIAAGCELKVPMKDIVSGISQFSPSKMRLNIFERDGIKIIDDVYNANPQSMEAAIGVLCDISEGARKIAVLGDMLELGDWAGKAHYDVGKFAAGKGVDYIITVGQNARQIAQGALEGGCGKERTASFGTIEEALKYANEIITQGDIILVKGSRGMKMEGIVNGLAVDSTEGRV